MDPKEKSKYYNVHHVEINQFSMELPILGKKRLKIAEQLFSFIDGFYTF